MPVHLTVVLISLLGCAIVGFLAYMMWMPGSATTTMPKEYGEDERRAAEMLEVHVRALSEKIGSRSVESYGGLTDAAYYIEQQFKDAGYRVRTQEYHPGGFAKPVANIEAELLGNEHPDKFLLLGAHYDSVGVDCPGADDNASGVAALLLLASRLRVFRPSISIRFIAFVNEEPPYFTTEDMGSFRYAQRAAEREEEILGMLALETIGYYSEKPGSQKYPFPFSLFYPNKGNFIAFVGDLSSAPLVRRIVKAFRKNSEFPSHGLAAPSTVPGVGWSDHWAFWQFGYPAVMVTDTAPFRNPHYHLTSDTWDTLDYPNFARVVLGLEAAIKAVAR